MAFLYILMLATLKLSLKEIEDYQNKKFLLAISGGIDSMVLLSLFSELGLNFSVAHCNFKLRETEANKDQDFVKQSARDKKAHFYTIDFDTLAYKKENKLSTQMAARKLRYNWFNEIKKQHNYDYIVTAHHLDDNVETVLLNLTRGTGINGIVGMKSVSNFIFRPLLKISKQKIIEFSDENNVDFREDQSNESNDYKRNKIRNQIMPLFQEMNPSFTETMGQNIEHFDSVNSIYTKFVENQLGDFVIKTQGDSFFIEIKKIKNKTQISYEFLSRFNFNYSQVLQLNSSLMEGNSTGKYFYSSSHKLLIDRKQLILSPNLNTDEVTVAINKIDKFVTYPIQLTFNEVPKEEFELKLDSSHAFLDADKLRYPLHLRVWKKGDSFSPFGMVGKKKISDYLIDEKISRIEKEKTYVLISNDEIVWLVGQRISDNYKVSAATNKVLNIILK
ncbi:MAG: tRNA lysidine(34) synthetase TilS [Flavobacteriales bacterium]|jgi:tRNA(Ile)-lysidine synthase|tara:strand:- start:9013 stop:10350 length:1338 start_codon:yes stop_codon:yes gene_type:complete